jgi:hypothetical protein
MSCVSAGPTFRVSPGATFKPNQLIPGLSVSIPSATVLACYNAIKTQDVDWKFPPQPTSSAATTASSASSFADYPAAAISGAFGAGRIVCFGPHPEGTSPLSFCCCFCYSAALITRSV